MQIDSVNMIEKADQLTVVADGITRFVPAITGNRFYDAVQEWVDEGGKITVKPQSEVDAEQEVKDKESAMQGMIGAQAELEALKKVAADGVDTTKEQAAAQAQYAAAKAKYSTLAEEA